MALRIRLSTTWVPSRNHVFYFFFPLLKCISQTNIRVGTGNKMIYALIINNISVLLDINSSTFFFFFLRINSSTWKPMMNWYVLICLHTNFYFLKKGETSFISLKFCWLLLSSHINLTWQITVIIIYDYEVQTMKKRWIAWKNVYFCTAWHEFIYFFLIINSSTWKPMMNWYVLICLHTNFSYLCCHLRISTLFLF